MIINGPDFKPPLHLLRLDSEKGHDCFQQNSQTRSAKGIHVF